MNQPKTYENDVKEHLWAHQRDAVDVVLGYIKDFNLYKGSDPFGSALLRMPTGTGKSGIIAVLAQCFPRLSTVLIVTPWTALRDQIKRDVSQRFWEHINLDPTIWSKQVQVLLPSNIDTVIQSTAKKPAILVCTIQTLQRIYSDHPISFFDLGKKIDLVMVDEGHREPAPSWAEAVRSLEVPTVLLSATPYRNDNKMFAVQAGYDCILTHQDAITRRYIRRVEFKEVKFPRNPDGFVDALLAYYKGEFMRQHPSAINEPRVIVRCKDSQEISAIASTLNDRGQKVVAIHDTFSSSDDPEDFHEQQAPNPEETDAVFWVHQNKLIEGIDDPRFSLLAIYQPHRNARALVQQIGRIIRQKSKRENEIAFVFSHPNDRQQAFWQGYLKYEHIFNENPEKFEPRQVFDTIIHLQPEYQYFDGNFRQRFDFDELPKPLARSLAYLYSARVYKIGDEFSLDELPDRLQEEWEKADRDIRTQPWESPDENTRVCVYQTCQNSPLLLEHALAEYKLGFTICHIHKGYLFFYDTQAGYSRYVTTTCTRVSPSILERLFKSKKARIKRISLVNSDIGTHVLRRRDLEAFSIQDTSPGLVDHAHFCSNAEGYTLIKDHGYVRRYVGFSRARVTDPTTIRCDYPTYIAWLDSLADTLHSGNSPHPEVFDRYARDAQPPEKPEAKNILLDLQDMEDDFVAVNSNTNGSKQPMKMDEHCLKVQRDSFTCNINDVKYKVDVSYDDKRKQYRLSCDEMAQDFVRIDPVVGEEQENIIQYLNHEQPFRIVPKSPKVIYSHGHFYEPRLPLWGQALGRFDLLKVLRGSPELLDAHSEKSPANKNGSGWTQGSLFYLLDRLGKRGGLDPDQSGIDILVCDDMGTEIGDFIAASTTQRKVMFVHAKDFKGRQLSASAFQEVCGQATKNLAWIHPYSIDQPPKLDKWDTPWDGGSKLGRVKKRIRRGPGIANEAWEELRRLITDPTTTREVWITLCNGLSAQELENQCKSKTPPPELVQLLFLLQSTWAAISSVGAIFRVYCLP